MIAVAKIRNKGRGLRATRSIKVATLLTRDPVLTFSRTEYRAVYGYKIGDYAFGWRDDSKEYAAIAFGLSSLANHSERPNADWECDLDGNTISLYAIRDIRPGEEITVCYGWSAEKKKRKFHPTRQKVPARAPT